MNLSPIIPAFLLAVLLPFAVLRADTPPAADDQAVHLDPFQITAEPASGYAVQEASSSSRMALPYIDVPQTVTVLTSELLTDLNTTVSREALSWAQSVIAGNNGSDGGSYMLRGLTITSAYRDGFLTSTAIVDRDSALYDRIEVVSGPASAAIGRGQAGGLINYVSKKPLERDFGTLTITDGTGNYQRMDLDYNQVVKSVSFRIPIFYQNGDGTYGADLNHLRKYGAGPSWLWNISPNTALLVNVTGWRSDGPGLSSEDDYLDKTGTIFRMRQSIGQYVGSAWNPFQDPMPSKGEQNWGYHGVGRDDDVGEFSGVLTSKLSDFVELRFGLYGDAMRDIFRFMQKAAQTDADPGNPNNFLQPMTYLVQYNNAEQIRDQGDVLLKKDWWGQNNQLDLGYDAFDLRSDAKSGSVSTINGVPLTDQLYGPLNEPPPGFNFYTSAPITAKSVTHQAGIGYYAQYLGSYWHDRFLLMAGIRQDNTDTKTFNIITSSYVLNANQVTHAPRYSLTYKPAPFLSVYYLQSFQEDPPVTQLMYTNFAASSGAVLPAPGDPRYSTYITGQTKARLDETGVKGELFGGSVTVTADYYRISLDGAIATTPTNDPSQATPAHPQALLTWNQAYLQNGVMYHGYEFSAAGHLTKHLTFTALYDIPEGRTLFNGVIAPGASLIREAKFFGKYDWPLAPGQGMEFTLGTRVLLGDWTIRSNSAVKYMNTQEGLDCGAAYYWMHRKFEIRAFVNNVTDNPQLDSTNNNAELRQAFVSITRRM